MHSSSPPPPGGQPQHGYGYQGGYSPQGPGQPGQPGGPGSMPPQRPAKRGGSSCLMIALVGVGGVLLLAGPLAVLSIYGVRKYLANAKTAEARSSLGQMVKGASEAYERDSRLCDSASRPVPRDASEIRGKKYLSSPKDWSVDKERNAGFACLQFEMISPQYFQYEYRAGVDVPNRGFIAEARGDLNGDGKLSSFKATGVVVGDALHVSTDLAETDPQE